MGGGSRQVRNGGGPVGSEVREQARHLGTVRPVIAVLAVSLAVAVIACVGLGARSARQARELTERQSTIGALEADIATAAENQAALEAEASRVTAEMAALAQRTVEADAARAASDQDLATAREAAAAADALAADAEARAEAATERAESAEQAALQATEQLAAADSPPWVGGPGPEVLWALELARTERTWRTSVAADPTSDVFDSPADPLRQAIEVDVGALREEVGVEFTVSWELESALEPVAALAVLRGTQELLAAATRVADEATVIVAADGDDVTIRLTGPDGSSSRFVDLGETLIGSGIEGVEGGIRVIGASRDVAT